MAPPRPSTPALSAPGLIGPNSILNPPATYGAFQRRAPRRPYGHVRLEIDLDPKGPPAARPGIVDRLETALSERKIVEGSDILRLAERALHALAAEGFRQVDHWEVEPGGWLPLGTPSTEGTVGEPLGALLRELDQDHWASLSQARAISLRLSHAGGNRTDLVLRRVHRQRRHSLTIDLWGRWEPEQLHALVGALRARMAVREVAVTRYRYV